MKVRDLFNFFGLVCIVFMISAQGCSTSNYYSDSELEDFNNAQKRTEAKKRVDSASKIRTIPNRRPESIKNSKANKGRG